MPATDALIGIDVGGTKLAAGVVLRGDGRVLLRRQQPTGAARGGAAVLADVVAMAQSLVSEAETLGVVAAGVGVGVAELVGKQGQVLSGATIAWEAVDVAAEISARTALPACVEADVRAAAHAEAQFGAGKSLDIFLYVTVGTGISACLVCDGVPYAGARGLTGTFASVDELIPGADGQLATGPALERYASGPALAARLAAIQPGFVGSTPDVLARAEAGDPQAAEVAMTGGEALGAAVGQLVNMLDPEAIVLGGGLGLVEGVYRSAIDAALRRTVWSPIHRNLPLLSARLGNDAVIMGSALAVADLAP